MMLAKSLVPPQGGRSQVRFGAEFQGIGTVDGVATEPESLSSRFSRFALKIFDRFVIFRDLFGFFLCWHLLHLAISTQSQSTDTLVDKCAVNSWLFVAYVASLMILIASSSTIRAEKNFNIMAETGLGLLYIFISIILAAATGPHRQCRAP